jgi:arsenate reductase-like glutaredoxin family protein
MKALILMSTKVLLFTQSGCLNCEVMKIFLEAKAIAYEERNMSEDTAARAELLEIYNCRSAPTVVILTTAGTEVVEGFDPDRLDRFLSAA